MMKGLSLPKPGPLQACFVFLDILMDKEGFFFFTCLHFLLPQSRAHDFIFSFYNNAVPFPTGLWS